MTKKESLKLFNDKKVRTVWDDEQEKWYFSVVDVIDILTDSPDPKRYWSVLKSRIKKEGLELTTICSTLKLRATDGKMRLTDVAETEQLFRIIQSVPSPKAEPFKQWMAELYLTSRTNVVGHIKHIYEEQELDEISTCRNFRQVRCNT